MPIDKRHKRYIPTGRTMARLLATILRGEWKRVAATIKRGEMPAFRGLSQRLQTALGSILAGYYNDGRTRELARYRAGSLTKQMPSPLDDTGPLQSAMSSVNRIVQSLIRFVSKILFATTDQPMPPRTRNQNLPTADEIDRLRSGFDADSADSLAAEEATRVYHEGQMSAAVSTGARSHKWLASWDACPRCKELDDKVVPIGQPFTIVGVVAITMPGLHRHCRCTLETVR